MVPDERFAKWRGGSVKPKSEAKSLPATGVKPSARSARRQSASIFGSSSTWIALAFQCDVRVSGRSCTPTRRAIQPLPVDQRARRPPRPLAPRGDPKKHAKLKILNRFHIEQFAYLLGKLKVDSERARAISTGSFDDRLRQRNQRRRPPQPRQFADFGLGGKGGGTIKPGRHLKVTPQPLNNLFLSMLDRIGAPIDRLGDSTGRLTKLEG